MTLPSLITRLEEAKGPDRELDADICGALLDAQVKRRREILPSYVYHTGDGEWSLIPAYSASLDAALSLAERVLPGCGVMLNIGSRVEVAVWPVSPAPAAFALAPTPALALCLAILRALAVKEGQQ